MILEVAYLDAVESCIISAIKESVSFDWIRLTGYPLFTTSELKTKM